MATMLAAACKNDDPPLTTAQVDVPSTNANGAARGDPAAAATGATADPNAEDNQSIYLPATLRTGVLVHAPRVEVPHHAFEYVYLGHEKQIPWVRQMGSRAILDGGEQILGFATSAAPPVPDSSLGIGLTDNKDSALFHIADLGGLWPNVAVLHATEETRGKGTQTRLYVHGEKGFTKLRENLGDVRDVIADKDAIYMYSRVSFFSVSGVRARDITGKPLYACRVAQQRQPIRTISLRGEPLPTPTARASFYMQQITNDGCGGAWVAGGDACENGAFIGKIESGVIRDDKAPKANVTSATQDAAVWGRAGNPVALERVPLTGACAERNASDGLTFTRAQVFPAKDGGIFVLVRNVAAFDDESRMRRQGACAAPPYVISRATDGTWGVPRVLPEDRGEVQTVDAAGTAWTKNTRGVIARIPLSGPITELTLAPSCIAPPEQAVYAALGANNFDGASVAIESHEVARSMQLFVPFPDQPWVEVEYLGSGQLHGLCYAPLDRPEEDRTPREIAQQP